MKKVKLPLFFKSREYRKMCSQYVVSVILSSIQAIWDLVKQNCQRLFYIVAYTNKEERALKIRRIEKERKNKELAQEKAIAYVFFKGAICSLDMCILSYVYNYRQKDLPTGYLEELHKQFRDSKRRIEQYGMELENMGTIIPEELKNGLRSIDKVDKFKYLGEYRSFITRVYNLCGEIEI